MDDEIEGEQVLRALGRSDPAAVIAALPGCRFYRDDPDDAEAIVAIDLATRTLTLRTTRGERRASLSLLGRGYVLAADDRLAAAVDAVRTPDDRAHDLDLRLLAGIGIVQPLPRAEAAALAAALRRTGAHDRPPYDDRRVLIDLLRRHDLGRPMLAVLRRWADGIAPIDLPGDIAIDLAWALRHAGQLTEALAATAIALIAPSPLSRPERAVIATQRAAILLDLFEARRDSALLDRARESAGIAWSLARSEETGAVYRRLATFEEAREDARHATARSRAEERLRGTDAAFRPAGRRPDR